MTIISVFFVIALVVSTRRGSFAFGAQRGMLARVRTQCNRCVFAVLRGDARSPWRAGTSQRLGDELQMGTKHGTSGVLSGPLTGSLLHSLNVNLGALEKSEKARNLIFVCRALSAKASLPAVAPRRSALQWPDRALAHGVPGGRLRRWSPTLGVGKVARGMQCLLQSCAIV